MLGGLSTRRYGLGLEPVGTQVEQTASGTSKSAVSRRFVAMTHTALAELLAADLSGLDLVGLTVDGVHFAEHCCVVALLDARGERCGIESFPTSPDGLAEVLALLDSFEFAIGRIWVEGSLNLLLSVPASGPAHGYAVIGELRERSAQEFSNSNLQENA